jgi:hypothetical protein
VLTILLGLLQVGGIFAQAQTPSPPSSSAQSHEIFPSLSGGQSDQQKTQQGENSQAPKFYQIEKVIFHIQGITLKPALAQYLDIEIGTKFTSKADLESYITGKERLLRDNRVFDLGSQIVYEIAPEGDPRFVKVFVQTKDSWTALAVPFPKYSSTYGLSLALRYKDFNFLGTLNPLNVSLDHYFLNNETDIGASFAIYPRMLGSFWNYSLSGDLTYTPTDGLYIYDFATALSSVYRFPRPDSPWSFTPSFSYNYWKIYTEHLAVATNTLAYSFYAFLNWTASATTNYTYEYITYPINTWMNSLGISTSVPVANLTSKALLTLNPSASVFYTFAIPTFGPSDAGFTLGSSFGYSAIDWIGNFRQGSAISLSTSYTDHLYKPSPTRAYDLLFNLNASAFAQFHNLIGVDFRLTGQWNASWTNLGDTTYSTNIDWGTYVRGIKDTLYGDIALIANLQFPINFAQGKFFNWSKMDAEVFLIPFVDAGYVRTSPSHPLWQISDAIFCGGMDMVVFPEYARAYTYRLSVGYNFLDLIQTKAFNLDKLEIWLGIGLHF